MADKREAVQWVAVHILRHEPALRQWLRRTGIQRSDIDDIVQQTYCKLSELDSVAHIIDPRAYFFTTARSFFLQRVRRDRVVNIQAASDLIDSYIEDQAPSPEQTIGARRELSKVFEVIAALPKRYRDVIELRRIEGLSQKETAKRLGITEKIVENSLARGIKAVLQIYERGDKLYAHQDEEMAEKVLNVSQR